MPDRRVVRADHHAIPLVIDIIESTSHFSAEIGDSLNSTILRPTSGKVKSLIDSSQCLIGFEDHFPFGFIAMRQLSDCCQLVALFLYRDYLERGYGDFLLDQGLELASEQKLRLIFALAPRRIRRIVNFLARRGFEEVSSEAKEIRDWRDGLLAEEVLGPDAVLMVYLQETPV